MKHKAGLWGEKCTFAEINKDKECNIKYPKEKDKVATSRKEIKCIYNFKDIFMYNIRATNLGIRE